jgi:hypothetical protein
MKLILVCVRAELAILGIAKTALNSNMIFKYSLFEAYLNIVQCLGQGISLKSKRNNP